MHLDNVPDLSFARLARANARGIALRDDDRAVGVIAIANGQYHAPDTIVRFDLLAGQDPGKMLRDALASTGARSIWFYGGDDVARRAAADLTLVIAPAGAVFVRRMDAASDLVALDLRPPSPRDRMTISEVQAEHAPGFLAPETLFAHAGGEIVGVVMSEALDAQWSELRVFVYPAHRGRGVGTAMFAGLADRLERAGRLVCAGIDTMEGRGRTALERAGFRLADYYFTARRPSP